MIKCLKAKQSKAKQSKAKQSKAKNYIKNLIFILIFTLYIFGIKITLGAEQVNVQGWIWSDNIGWISLSSNVVIMKE